MLEASVDQATRDEIEAAWADEIKDRLAEIDRGEVEMIPWETVKKEFRMRAGIRSTESE
jgi:putative addiction module component (TIGR02574 family)